MESWKRNRTKGFAIFSIDSFLTTPDGMPTVWLGRIHGFKHMNRVYGPDYMLGLCERSVAQGYRHFLYGGKPGVAEELRDRADPEVSRD